VSLFDVFKKKLSPEPFAPRADDPLLPEHQAVAQWIADALASLNPRDTWRDVDLKSLPTGIRLLDADPEQAKRYVLAAMLQLRHWDEQGRKIKATAADGMTQMNPQLLPGWGETWAQQRKAGAVAAALLRRTLPFTKGDLLVLLECSAAESVYVLPVGGLARAIERYAAGHEIEPALRDAIRRFGARLRGAHDTESKRHRTKIEQLCADGGVAEPDPPAELGPPPSPAPAGSPTVLATLKRQFGIEGGAPDSPVVEIGPDRFPLRDDSPLRKEHEKLSELFEELVASKDYHTPRLGSRKVGRQLLSLDPAARGRVLLAAAERRVGALLGGSGDYNDGPTWQSRYAAAALVPPLAEAPFDLARADLFDLLLYMSTCHEFERAAMPGAEPILLTKVEREAGAAPLTEGERHVLHLWRASLIAGPPLGAPSDAVAKLGRWIGDGASFYLVPGEAWTDALNADVARLAPEPRGRWVELLRHLLTATSARPSGKWTKGAAKLVDAVGPEQVRASLSAWFPLVSRGRSLRKLGAFVDDTRGGTDVLHEENASILRGMLWLVPLLPGKAELVRRVTAVAISAYKKVPGVGPRAVKVGNAAVYALSEMGSIDAVGQLAMLKVRVRFGTAQKEIQKAFDVAAEALALPRDQIEEMGVPSYGLEDVGRREETIGGYRAELRVTGTGADLHWFDSAGRALKAAPSKVGKEHKEQLKELQQSQKDIEAMLPAQRDRIDSLFLAERAWPYAVWRERYLDHPLVGTIARRLIWCVDGRAATFLDGAGTDIEGTPVDCREPGLVQLWHPAGRTTEEITAWRRRLRDISVTQPFKQAHREIYLLTDAERNTRTYSNRFAAHILRQHQFSALCAARGWKNRLRLMVDDVFPPASRELPAWGLRAEFWIEGVGGDYGVDTNEAGVFLRVASDQVRFYRTDVAQNTGHAGGGGYSTRAGGSGRDNVNDAIPLDQVPPLVFSEVLRDLDLFVGVASVGNDPAWQDGGPGGRYRDYWHSYSFGELSATAATRRDVLQQLVPLLKIADQCSFADRFLVVRGHVRTYRIHLGSGNILMEPNDQYLCIVPDARARSGGPDVALPFEGDSVLSIVLSKALLLADDTKIKDPTILRQIRQ
jgi:hypothetical protein